MPLSFLRDIFDANTKEDQRKRLARGGKRYYKEDELARGNKRPKENLAAQALPGALKFLNTTKAGIGGVYGLLKVGGQSIFGTDESYEKELQGVNKTLERDLSPTSGAFGAGTFFDDAENARNISGAGLTKKIVGGGLEVAADVTPTFLGKAAKGASWGAKAARAGVEGAIAGGIGTAGSQLTEQGDLNAKGIATGAAFGAALGAGTSAASSAYGGAKKAVIEAAKPVYAHSEIPEKYAKEYADILKAQEEGARGGDLVPDGEGGYKRITDHSKFYRDYYKEHKRAPSQKAWLEHAKTAALEDPEFMAYVRDETNPENLSLLNEADTGALGQQDVGGRITDQTEPLVGEPTKGRTRRYGFLSTAEDNPNYSPEMQQAAAGAQPQRYRQKANAPTVDAARELVDNNYNKAVSIVDNANTPQQFDEAVIIGGELLAKAAREGRTQDAAKIAEDLAAKGLQLGRGVQAFAAIKRMTPEGMLVFAQRELKKANDNLGFIDKMRGKKVDNPVLDPEAVQGIVDRMKVVENLPDGTAGKEALQIKQSLGATPDSTPQFKKGELDDVVNKAVEQITGEGEQTVAEKVAKKVGAAVDPKKKKAKVDELVNELSAKIKKDILEIKPKKVEKNYKEIIRGVLERNQEAQQAFPEVKDILRERFADNPEALDALEKLFRQAELDYPVSKGTINKAVAQQLKESKVEIKKIIYKRLSDQKKMRDEILDELVVRGVDQDVAIKYAESIIDDINGRLFDAKKKVLDQMAREAPPRARQTIIDKINKLSNLGALDDLDYLELARKKLGLPDLDADTARRLSEYAQEIQDNPQMSSQLVAEVFDIINEQTPIGASEIFDSYRYQNLLSNPRTQARNSISNLFNTMITRPMTLLVNGTNDYFAATLRGKERQNYVSEVPQYYKEMFNSFGDAIEAFKAAWRGDNPITNPDIGALRNRRQKMIPRKFTAIPRFMEAQDKFFSTLIGSGEYGALRSKGVGHEAAMDAAERVAEYSLFRGIIDPDNATGQGKLLSSIDKVTDSVMKFGSRHKAFKWFVPFVRTPLNVTKQFIEFSPAGIATLPGAGNKGEQVSKALIGTMVFMTGAKLALDGMTTWDAPKDEKQRELFYASGRRPFSVKIGDKWVPMIYFGPLAYSLALPAAIKDANDDADLTDSQMDKLTAALSNQAKFFSQQTYVQGIANMVDVISGQGDTSLMASLGFTAGQAIPFQGLSRYVNGILDPVFRKKTTLAEGALVDVPILGAAYSKSLETYQDPITGEPARRNITDYTLPYTLGLESGSVGQKEYVKAATGFYKNLRKITPLKTKYNDDINAAVEAGDYQEAQRLATKFNAKLRDQFKNWAREYGQYKNEESLAGAYNRTKIKLTRSSLAQRRYSALRKQQERVIPG